MNDWAEAERIINQVPNLVRRATQRGENSAVIMMFGVHYGEYGPLPPTSWARKVFKHLSQIGLRPTVETSRVRCTSGESELMWVIRANW